MLTAVMLDRILDDEALAAFGEMLLRGAVERPKQVHRDAALTWNRMLDRIKGWPAVRFTLPNNKRTYALPLEAFPQSFATDLQAYLDRQTGKDLFGNAPSPASPVTLRCQRIWLGVRVGVRRGFWRVRGAESSIAMASAVCA
jgi:hypothetical protein